MKKTKVLFVLFFILFMSIIPFNSVNAHSVELDPEKLISFPWLISDGKGSISIDDSETGYTLYYQAVEILDANYTKMEELQTEGEAALDIIDTELDKLKAEYQNLNTDMDEAFDAWEAKVDSSASEDEIAAARTAYETAKTNYNNKVKEYNDKAKQYNAKVQEINNNINALIPTYVENNWIKTENGDFKIDLTQFSGDKAFAIWAKLVTSDGTISYDESTYTMSGTKPKEIEVESITLDKTILEMTEGSNHTLVAKINPSDATNKLVIWASDSENVAKVEDGKVTAISEGTATITATTKDGGYTATCKVTVVKKAEEPTPDNDKKEEVKPDSTVANQKLPNAGDISYKIVLVVAALSVIGIIMYKKVKYLNFK